MTAENKTLPAFGERLKSVLCELNIKQVEFARSLGVSANYIYLLSSGRKRGISEPLARLIESTYGYRAGWLLTGEGEKMAAPAKESLKTDTINKIRRMSPAELRAIAAFIRSLEETEG